MTDCTTVGIKYFCGCVDVMDPTLDKPLSVKSVKAGLYSCCVWRSKTEKEGNLYSAIEKIGIYLNGKFPEANSMKKLGKITVKGLAGFFINKPNVTGKLVNVSNDALRNSDSCTGKDGFFGVPGYGAGEYPVYCFTQGGEIIALEIIFKEEQ